jgi:CBS domain containing-hemolysin-like protein
MEEVHKTRHARYLVIDDSLDNVLGVLDLRQLADPIAKGEMQANSSLEPYIKPVIRVLETSTLAELLPLIKNGNPLLLVVDEYGGTEGLITSADLTGEIVGDDIQFDNKEAELRPIDDSKKIWITSGEIEVIELNKELELELPEADDHYTLAGFVLEKLQEIPNPGETFVHNEIVFEILSMKGPRINKVKIILPK